MRYFVVFSLITLFGGEIFPQDSFVRLKNESVQKMTERYIEARNESDTNSSPLYLMHDAVEIQFGISERKRIVTLIQSDYYTRVYLFTQAKDDLYSVDVFGEIIYGFPGMDRILSVFSFDHDEDGKNELFVLGKGGVRDVNEEGMWGCCVDIYDCAIFTEDESGVFSEIGFYPRGIDYGSCHTASEIKAAFTRNKLDGKIRDITKDENLNIHLNRLDSVDRRFGLPVPRTIIDKIYELPLGGSGYRYKVVSTTRKTDSSLIYSVGVFAKDSNDGFFYSESEYVHLENAMKCKVESVFGYDADKYGEGHKELIVLLSVVRNGNAENEFMPLVFSFYDYGQGVTNQESWRFGLHEEKNASEIKKAIEYYHQHKYDETPRD